MEFALTTWIVITIVLFVIELITRGMTTIWFAFGGIAAIIVMKLDGPVWQQILVFFVVAVITLILFRPSAMKLLRNTKPIETNAKRLIGKEARVTVPIDNQKGTGQVVIDEMEWTARSESDSVAMDKDQMVVVKAIEGVKLIVALKKEEV